MHLSMSSPKRGGGWGVGHRVRILTFSKKTLSKSPPLGKKCLLKVSVTIGLLLFCSLKLKDQCMTSDENPHPGDYFAVKFPGHPSSLTLIGALLRPSTLFWPEKNLCQPVSYLTNPFNTATPLIQKLFVASWNRINGAPLHQFNRLTYPGSSPLHISRTYAILGNVSHPFEWSYTTCNEMSIIYLKSNPRIRRKNIIKQLHSSPCYRHLETKVAGRTAVLT